MTTAVGDDQFLERKARSPFYRNSNLLDQENSDHDLIEVSMRPKTITDDKPIHMSAAILSNSKLHFLKFIYEFVYVFFIPGSFVLSYCDTDSICIGFTQSQAPENDSRRAELLSIMLPVIKPELKNDFFPEFERWFVTQNNVTDEKCPGKLKGIFTLLRHKSEKNAEKFKLNFS